MGKFVNTKIHASSEYKSSEDSSLEASLMDVFNEPSEGKNDIFGLQSDVIKLFSKFNCGQLIKANKFDRSVDVEVDLKEFIKLSATGNKVVYMVDIITEKDLKIDKKTDTVRDSLKEDGLLNKAKTLRFYIMCDGFCFSTEYITQEGKEINSRTSGINQEEIDSVMTIN